MHIIGVRQYHNTQHSHTTVAGATEREEKKEKDEPIEADHENSVEKKKIAGEFEMHDFI